MDNIDWSDVGQDKDRWRVCVNAFMKRGGP
jgi:hypothetical protein